MKLSLTPFIRTLALAALMLCLSATRAHATSYSYVYNCSDGGTITTTTSISPTGPFAPNTHPQFTSYAQLNSTCAAKTVSVEASNNSSDYFTTILPASVGPGKYPNPIPAPYQFVAPDASGNYAINFRTGVDDTVAVGPLHVGLSGDFPRYNQNDDPIDTDSFGLPIGNAGGKLIVKINGTTVCDTSDATGFGYNIVDCGSTFFPIKVGDVIAVTAQSYLNYYAGGTYEVRTLEVTNGATQVYKYYNGDHYGSPSGTICGEQGGGYYNGTPTDPNGTCNLQTYTFTVPNNSTKLDGYQIYTSFIGTGV